MLGGKGLERVKDRVVFIGATAEGLFDLRVTPFSPNMPGVEKHANMAANILERRFIVRPVWIELAEMAGIIAFPLLLALVLPIMRPVPSIFFTLAVGAALFGAAHYAFRRELWIPLVYPSLALLLTFIAVTVYRFFTEERQRQYTKRAFQQYVSPEVVARIVDNPEALQFGGELRNLTVLFSDIRDFTTFTEKHDPQLVVQMLREYLTEMTRIVIEEGGTLDKYIGDAVMAVFGAPIVHPDHALRACRAALRMAAEVGAADRQVAGRGPRAVPHRHRHQHRRHGRRQPRLRAALRLHGHRRRGEPGRAAGSHSTRTTRPTAHHHQRRHLRGGRDAIEVRELGEVKVKGKTRPVVVYELVGLRPRRRIAQPTRRAATGSSTSARIGRRARDAGRAHLRRSSCSSRSCRKAGHGSRPLYGGGTGRVRRHRGVHRRHRVVDPVPVFTVF